MPQMKTNPKEIAGYGAAHPFVVRACAPGDEERLALLGAATFLETYAGVLPSNAILAHCGKHHAPEAYRAWLDSADTHIAIAEVEDAPVGYAVVCPVDSSIQASPGDIELRRIYLLHRFQGAGIGAALMDWVIDTAEALGNRHLVLGVYPGNKQAIEFYVRCGFTQAGYRTFQVGDLLFLDPVFKKELSPKTAKTGDAFSISGSK
jgi:diamine N-acetyltransferase